MLLFFALGCAPEEPTPICPVWSGLSEVGRTWRYREFAGDGEEWEARLEELGLDRVVVEGDQWREQYVCDDEGLWIELRTQDDEAGAARWEFDPPGLVMPATLAVGDAWTAAWAWRYSDASGAVATASSSAQWAVVGETESNVSAGAFDTLEMYVYDEENGGDSRYYAPGVGLVLSGASQLVSME